MDSFVDKELLAQDKEEIDYAFCQWAHDHGHCFDPFDNRLGRRFIKLLRPAYAAAGGLPSRKTISGRHLIKHQMEIQGRVISNLKNASAIGMSTNGWTDHNSNGLHSIMVGAPIPFFIGSHRASNQDEKAPQLLKSVKAMVNKVSKFFTDTGKPTPKLIGLVTDSPAANKAMRALCSDDEKAFLMNIVPYGCICHRLNNHVKTIVSNIDQLGDLLKDVKALAKKLGNVKHVKYHLNEIQKAEYGKPLQILMESETRWNFIVAMFESVLRSKKAILNLATRAGDNDLTPKINLKGGGHSGIDTCDVDISVLIVDPIFWKRLEAAVLLLKPIAILVTYLESDTAPLSMYAGAFIKLLRTYKAWSLMDGPSFPFQNLGLTKEMFIDTGTHTSVTFPDLLRRVWMEITSNSVNPSKLELFSSLTQFAVYLDEGTRNLLVLAQKEGISLDGSRRSIAAAAIEGCEFLVEVLLNDQRYVDLHESAQQFTNNVANCIQNLIQQGVQLSVPTERKALYHPLRQIQFQYSTASMISAMLFAFPTSATSGERCFNFYGAVHAKQRNRMSVKKLDSMVFVRMNRRQLERATAHMENDARSEELLKFFYSGDGNDSLVCEFVLKSADQELSEVRAGREDDESFVSEGEAVGDNQSTADEDVVSDASVVVDDFENESLK